MGARGGFNPFRDGHGRYADTQTVGGGNRESLSAPLASKTEWTSGGVSVEFTGGKSPAYRVVHEGRVIKEFPATATWRRDLEQAKQHGASYLIQLQTESANQVVRRDMAGQDELGKIRQAAGVAGRVESVEAYHAAGAQVMAVVNATPAVMGMRAKLDELGASMQQKPPAEWSAKDSQDLANARWNLGYAIREQAIDLIGKLRPLATKTDLNIEPLSIERGLEMADEMVEFFPQQWVEKAGRWPLLVEATPTPNQRSHYQHTSRAIYLSEGAGRATMVHEMGHWLEGSIPKLERAARSYLQSRTAGEESVSMGKTYGRHTGYRDDEMTKPDRFEHFYMGKQYPTGATEIVSMMCEEYTDGKHGVTLRDPGMFQWFLGVMVSV
jgi:hypothetical protein